MKVNLGSASKIFVGWKNIDHDDILGWARKHNPLQVADIERWFEQTDIRAFLERTPDNVVEAYSMIHVLDHFTPAEALWILQQIKRTLVPGGVLRVEVEHLDHIIQMWHEGRLNEFNEDQPPFYRTSSDDMKVALLVFGNLAEEQEYTGHKMSYTRTSLNEMIKLAGFEKIIFSGGGKDMNRFSNIEGWQPEWNTQPDHSLFMECQK